MKTHMRLFATGASDVYFTSNPQITFFKNVYKHHNQFIFESNDIIIDDVIPGTMHKMTIPRNGDLLSKLTLKLTLNSINRVNGYKFAWVKRLGHCIIDYVAIFIGNTIIDKQYGMWMDILYELSYDSAKTDGYKKLIGDVPVLTELQDELPEYTLYIPLQFWFCRNYKLALPLIALQYHEIRLDIKFNQLTNLLCHSNIYNYKTSIKTLPFYSQYKYTNFTLLANYVWVNNDERVAFAKRGHEYLIEQIQYNSGESVINTNENTNKLLNLYFYHPVKELIFANTLNSFSNGSFFLGYGNSTNDILDYAGKHIVEQLFLVIKPEQFSYVSSGNIHNKSNNIIISDNKYIAFRCSTSNTNKMNLLLENYNRHYQYKLNLIFNVINNHDNVDIFSHFTNKYLLCPDFNSFNNQYLKYIDHATVLITLNVLDSSVHINCIDVKQHLTISSISHDISDTIPNNKTLCTYSHNPVFVINPLNYGMYLDGTGSILQSANLESNDNRTTIINKYLSTYLNSYKPYIHHHNCPPDGIYVYSFHYVQKIINQVEQ